MLDQIQGSRTLRAHFRGSEVHNELLQDESIVFTQRIFVCVYLSKKCSIDVGFVDEFIQANNLHQIGKIISIAYVTRN